MSSSIFQMGNLEFWMRHLSSKSGAFAVINLSAGGGPSKVKGRTCSRLSIEVAV